MTGPAGPGRPGVGADAAMDDLLAAWPSSGPADPPRAAARDAVARALAEDMGQLGDLTAMLVPETETIRVRVVARADGVLAGRLCALEAFAQVDPALVVDWRVPDGGWLAPGSVVAEVSGPMRSVLTAERTALNFLCHLSGVATLARRFVDAVTVANPATRVLDTRKTTPGLRALEKAAVRAGGGWNHRAGLSDAVLVKDNHLGRLGIAEAVALARRWWPGRMVEVECDRPEQVSEAVDAGASAVLLDNMTPSQVSECVALVRARTAEAPGTVLVEVSGGVTLERAPAYAAAGADLISVGAITHSAPIVDLGLDIVED
ncbi:MAG TPA: carboxylating nicotinate-nucleotide diphosphorylase [Acidimicrobiales bacterium]|nr:carboxylating nicotinate-nucleotide diphosphorylase [Acidimicrobiales bacterium]